MTTFQQHRGPAAPTLLVIVAHPDDETFGCGSLLLYARACGARTVVVSATRGEAGELSAGVDAPDGIAALRERELRAAADLLGVSAVDVWAFHDSGMDGQPARTSLCGAAIEDVVDSVRAAVAQHQPDVIVTLDGGDGHRDHLAIRGAVEQAIVGSTIPLYLHALPRSLMHAWVRHHAGDDAATAYTELPEIGTPDEQITTILDTSAYLAGRDAAIATHRSQQSPFNGLPEDLRRSFLCRDHLIRINPPWPGSPREHHLTGIDG